MRILLLIIYFCVALPIQATDVYRSVDENGHVIFSDTPVAGSEKINVDEIQTIAPGEVPKFEYTPPPQEEGEYSRLEIISPQNDSVIQSDDGKVMVNAVVEPLVNLKEGHYLVLYLDGTEAASGTSPQFMLSDIEHGTHVLSIAVLDQSGHEVKRSSTISFSL
jgi:hypothetical protein